MRRVSAIVIASHLLAIFGVVHAQPPCRWEPMELYRGADRWVRAIQEWDPDGAGPSDTVLVFGGDFSTFGPVIGRVVTWDGVQIRPLAEGLPPGVTLGVRALAVHNGDLYCASEDVGPVLRWDGQRWISLPGAASGDVAALGSYAGRLIAAGDFTSIGGVAASRIAAWDGIAWSPLGQGLSGPAMGSGWVGAVTEYNGELIAGGRFTVAGGQSASNIAAWDGAAWRPLGAGVSSTSVPLINALTAFEGDLIVTGVFDHAGGLPAANVARWNGSDWAPMSAAGSYAEPVVHNGSLYLFDGYAFKQWSGHAWTVVSTMDNPVLAAASFSGMLVTGGGIYQAGGAWVSNVALWDGAEWHPLIERGYVGDELNHVASFGNQLLASGYFYAIGGQTVTKGAIWDGAMWRQIAPPTGWSPYGVTCIEGPRLVIVGSGRLFYWDGATLSNGPVFPFTHLGPLVSSLTAFQGGVVAAGYIGDPYPGVTSVFHWNGTEWVQLGGSFNGNVLDVHVHDGALFAAGNFTAVSGQSGNYVVRWNGSSWMQVGNGLPQPATKLETFQGDLIAAGLSVARWDGSSWHDLGVALYPAARDMTVHQGELVVSGVFIDVGPPAFGGIRAWNGTSWRFLNDVNLGGVLLASHGNELIAAGMNQIDGGAAAQLARYTCDTCYPNCDGSTQPRLTTHDFTCFLQRFAAGDPYANCDQSSAAPTLNVADFTCFLRHFASGCP